MNPTKNMDISLENIVIDNIEDGSGSNLASIRVYKIVRECLHILIWAFLFYLKKQGTFYEIADERSCLPFVPCHYLFYFMWV